MAAMWYRLDAGGTVANTDCATTDGATFVVVESAEWAATSDGWQTRPTAEDIERLRRLAELAEEPEFVPPPVEYRAPSGTPPVDSRKPRSEREPPGVWTGRPMQPRPPPHRPPASAGAVVLSNPP